MKNKRKNKQEEKLKKLKTFLKIIFLENWIIWEKKERKKERKKEKKEKIQSLKNKNKTNFENYIKIEYESQIENIAILTALWE